MLRKIQYVFVPVLVLFLFLFCFLCFHSKERILSLEEQNQVNDCVKQVTLQPLQHQIKRMVNGIYISGAMAAKPYRTYWLRLLDGKKYHAVVIDVKNDAGQITYAMKEEKVKKVKAIHPYIKDLPELLKQLKKKNIYVIARIVTLQDPVFAKKRKACMIAENGRQFWLDPRKTEVKTYLAAIAKQAAKDGFDEIQMDYVRFPTDRRIALSGEKKIASITAFVRYMKQQLLPFGVALSADVFGTIMQNTVDEERVGQRYETIAKWVDVICPMIYPSHYANGTFGVTYPDLEPAKVVRMALQQSRKKLQRLPAKDRPIVRPWLQDFSATWLTKYQQYGEKQVLQQMKAVEQAGYQEWLLWNAASQYHY